MGLGEELERSTATRGCGRPAWAASWSSSGRSTRSTRATATSCAGASSTARRRQRRAAGATPAAGPRGACTRSSSGASCGAPIVQPADGSAPTEVRASTRSSPTAPTAASAAPSARSAPEWPYGTAIRTYWESPPRRAVDRVGPRRQGPQRQPDARLRLDLPGRRRHREHRRRAAVDVPRLQERQHDAPARRATPTRSPSAGRSTPTTRGRRPAAASRWADRSGPAGPTYLVVGDAAGSVNPFNGEGIDYAYETAAWPPT